MEGMPARIPGFKSRDICVMRRLFMWRLQDRLGEEAIAGCRMRKLGDPEKRLHTCEPLNERRGAGGDKLMEISCWGSVEADRKPKRTYGEGEIVSGKERNKFYTAEAVLCKRMMSSDLHHTSACLPCRPLGRNTKNKPDQSQDRTTMLTLFCDKRCGCQLLRMLGSQTVEDVAGGLQLVVHVRASVGFQVEIYRLGHAHGKKEVSECFLGLWLLFFILLIITLSWQSIVTPITHDQLDDIKMKPLIKGFSTCQFGWETLLKYCNFRIAQVILREPGYCHRQERVCLSCKLGSHRPAMITLPPLVKNVLCMHPSAHNTSPMDQFHGSAGGGAGGTPPKCPWGGPCCRINRSALAS
ncbi:hypothetical protein VP01_3821g1 [Puccinia sorghi]|uniref:Uncharacterized protein n=1 Tax=Puccinia sorghi TaxID=27349 RepID=A0A0L6UU27_9BASI|nr:hypothetical protein VP01_3821g1 [Puccinia sorghi]